MNYDVSSTDANLLAVSGVLLLALVLFCLVFYIFSSLGLYKMALNEGIPNPWLAWIPVGNSYIMGELISTKLNGNGGVKYLVISIAGSVLSAIPVIGPLVSLAAAVFSLVVLYWLFEKYSDNPVLHIVLSILIFVYSPFAIFALRNNQARY